MKTRVKIEYQTLVRSASGDGLVPFELETIEFESVDTVHNLGALSAMLGGRVVGVKVEAIEEGAGGQGPGGGETFYARRDIEDLCGYYTRHLDAMTREGLHSKSEIAAELAWRDREIDAAQSRTRLAESALEGWEKLALSAEVLRKTAESERDGLRIEVETLRRFGNKDCTAMADEEMARGRAAEGEQPSASEPHSESADHDGKAPTDQAGRSPAHPASDSTAAP